MDNGKSADRRPIINRSIPSSPAPSRNLSALTVPPLAPTAVMPEASSAHGEHNVPSCSFPFSQSLLSSPAGLHGSVPTDLIFTSRREPSVNSSCPGLSPKPVARQLPLPENRIYQQLTDPRTLLPRLGTEHKAANPATLPGASTGRDMR
jgi:hypothetical protein